MAVVEVNNKIRVLISEESKEIERLLLERAQVTNQAEVLITNAEVLTDLDFARLNQWHYLVTMHSA